MTFGDNYRFAGVDRQAGAGSPVRKDVDHGLPNSGGVRDDRTNVVSECSPKDVWKRGRKLGEERFDGNNEEQRTERATLPNP